MRNFMKLAQNIDVRPLMLALTQNPDMWHADTYMRDYPQGPFGQIHSILLRFPVKRVFEMEEDLANYNAGKSQWDWHESVDYPVYNRLHAARPIIQDLMRLVEGERLGRVIINRIVPGGKIDPHEDTPIHTSYYKRFHVVLQSAPGVQFIAGDENAYMATGEAWWFDNKTMHEVINSSAVDRIHMVVDIRCRTDVYDGVPVEHKGGEQ